MYALGKMLRLLLLVAWTAVLGAPDAFAGMALPEHGVMPAADETMPNAPASEPCCGSAEKLDAPCEHPGLCAAISSQPKLFSVAGHGFASASPAGPESAGYANGGPLLIPPDQSLHLPGRKLSVLFCSFQI
jgi:hypothetical protein